MSVDPRPVRGRNSACRYFRNATNAKIRRTAILGKHNYDRYLAILSEGTEPL